MAKLPKITSSTDVGPSPDTLRRFDAISKQEAVALALASAKLPRSCTSVNQTYATGFRPSRHMECRHLLHFGCGRMSMLSSAVCAKKFAFCVSKRTF